MNIKFNIYRIERKWNRLGFNIQIAVLIIIVFVCLFTVPLISILTQTEPGDVLVTNTTTPVYSSYVPGKFGDQLCTIPENTEVVIIEKLTSNDLPGSEPGMYAALKAYYIEVVGSGCKGWVLPNYLD